jgi:Leucine-rich repeat (LRR) protein
MLANNKISEIGDLGEFLPNLQNLFLMNNRVKEQQQIKNLAGCRELSTLILSNNPIC